MVVVVSEVAIHATVIAIIGTAVVLALVSLAMELRKCADLLAGIVVRLESIAANQRRLMPGGTDRG